MTVENRQKAFEGVLESVRSPHRIVTSGCREIGRESARALEMLGNATDHLVDQLMVDQDLPISAAAMSIWNAEIEAIEILLAVSRVLYLSSPRRESLSARFQEALRGWGGLAEREAELELMPGAYQR